MTNKRGVEWVYQSGLVGRGFTMLDDLQENLYIAIPIIPINPSIFPPLVVISGFEKFAH